MFTKSRSSANKHFKWIACSFVASIALAFAFGKETPTVATSTNVASTSTPPTPATGSPATASDQTAAPVPEKPKKAGIQSASDDKKLSKSKEFLWIRANQRILLKKLRDPDSAKFSDEYVSYKAGGPIVCGRVNSKNAFGGYTGPQRYIGGGDTVGVFLSSEVDGFDALWRKTC